MSTGGWLTKKKGTIKERASFTKIQIDLLSLKLIQLASVCHELHMKVVFVSEDTLAKLISTLVTQPSATVRGHKEVSCRQIITEDQQI